MSKFKVPESAEEAVEQLGALGRRVDALNRLLSARKWERAAIIACLVGPERGKGRPPTSLNIETFPYSTVTLSELGIYGLRSSNTVAHYRNVWCRERPIPDWGDEVDLEGLPEWTGTVRTGLSGTASAARPEPERRPEPGDPDYDTEAAAVREAERSGSLRLDRQTTDEESTESTQNGPSGQIDGGLRLVEPDVDAKVQVETPLADDKLHEAIGLLRDARAMYPEDRSTIDSFEWRRSRWERQVAELSALAEELTGLHQQSGRKRSSS
jgi:hypothetical protein